MDIEEVWLKLVSDVFPTVVEKANRSRPFGSEDIKGIV
jgi:hypothetical protein